MDQNTKDILAAVNFIKDTVGKLPTRDEFDFIKDHMLTKDDVREIIREEINALVPAIVANEVKDTRERLTAVEDSVAEHNGFAKEIDHGLERTARIEKHLGIAA